MPAANAPYPGFQRIVEVYAPASGAVGSLGAARTDAADNPLTTVPLEGAQAGTLETMEPPWFTLLPDRGVGRGQLQLRRLSRGARVTPAVYRGDIVVFRPEAGVEWARLVVTRIREMRDRIVYDLEGESYAFRGRSTADNDVDLTGKTPGEAVSWLLNNSLSDYNTSPLLAQWSQQRRINEAGDALGSYIVGPQTSVEEVLLDLAELDQGDSAAMTVWGVSNGMAGSLSAGTNGSGRFSFFAPLPTGNQITWDRTMDRLWLVGASAPLVNQPATQTGRFWNAIEVVDRDGISYVETDTASIAAERGYVRMARAELPTVSNATDARRYGRAFLRKYARTSYEYDMLQTVVPGPGALPLPWGGRSYIQSTDSDNGDGLPIRSVRVLFDVQPLCEIEVGHWDNGSGSGFGRAGRVAVGTPLHEALQQQRRVRGGGTSDGEGGGSSSGDTVIGFIQHQHAHIYGGGAKADL